MINKLMSSISSAITQVRSNITETFKKKSDDIKADKAGQSILITTPNNIDLQSIRKITFKTKILDFFKNLTNTDKKLGKSSERIHNVASAAGIQKSNPEYLLKEAGLNIGDTKLSSNRADTKNREES